MEERALYKLEYVLCPYCGKVQNTGIGKWEVTHFQCECGAWYIKGHWTDSHSPRDDTWDYELRVEGLSKASAEALLDVIQAYVDVAGASMAGLLTPVVEDGDDE